MSVLLHGLSALAAVALLAFAAWGVGAVVASAAPPELGGQVRALAGLGFLGVLLFLAGMLYWGPVLILALLIPLAAVGGADLARLRPCLPSLRSRIWLVLAFPVAACLGLDAFVPPMGNIGNDAISYHLVGPVLWLRAHCIFAPHDNFPATYPALVETLFGAAMAISNHRAAALVAAFFAALLLAQAWGLVRDLGGDVWCAALALTLLVCMPVVMDFAALPFVDLAYAAFALAAARLAWAASRPRHWVAAGCLFGFAVGTKYTGLMLLAASLAALFLTRRGRRVDPAPPSGLGLAAAIALVVGGAWYVRNWIVFGAPIYPLPLSLAAHWPMRYLPLAAVGHFQAYLVQRGQGMGHGWRALLLLPFHYTFSTAFFQGGGGLGVVPLAFAPWALPRLARQPHGRFWLVWIALLTLLWFVTIQESRYLVPVVVVCTCIAALAAGDLLRRSPRPLKVVASLALAVSLAYGAGAVIWDGGQRPARIHTLFSPAAAQAMWNREVPYAAAFAFLNGQPDTGTVLVLDSSVPIYYLHRSYEVLQGPWGERPEGALTLAQALRRNHPSIVEILDVRPPDSGFRLTDTSTLHLVFATPTARIYRPEH